MTSALTIRRFLTIVSIAILVSCITGYVIALVYVMNLDVEAVEQPPFRDPTQVEQEATAGLLPPSPNG